MSSGHSPVDILDMLEVGLSGVTWGPDFPQNVEWVFVNEARARMVGRTKQELLETPPNATATRETKARQDAFISAINAEGRATFETTLLHKSGEVIPVVLHVRLIEREVVDFLLVEHHDIRYHKTAEARLQRSEENTREMLNLIEKEKQQLAGNIEDNLGLVTYPLIDQLLVAATPAQKQVLDLLRARIRRVTTELKIATKTATLGANLTRRQMVICEMIREGMTSKDIASALDCAPSTVNNHRNIIRKKLGLSGKTANLQAFLNQG